MSNTAPLASEPEPDGGRGPQGVGPRPAPGFETPTSPVALVRAALEGRGLREIAAGAARPLDCPVLIAVPAIGPPAVVPARAVTPRRLSQFDGRAREAIRSGAPPADPSVIPVMVGGEVHGLVATSREAIPTATERAWLHGAAAAAAVSMLLRRDTAPDATLVFRGLTGRDPGDRQSALVRARRAGVDLEQGATAICGRLEAAWPQDELAIPGVLAGEMRPGVAIALTPTDGPEPTAVARRWREHGALSAVSAHHPRSEGLGEAIAEAELLVELGCETCGEGGRSSEPTIRLLIGVLLRDREQLVSLEESTIGSLLEYDGEHDTDLLATLSAFLERHGSTTETAEAMALHRHTVGYRLARVQDVTGLSPYESEGRERLGLGLKAHSILAADARRAAA